MKEELIEQPVRKKGARYSRVQRKGQVTIPVDLRAKLGLEEGDLVTFTETPQGVLIAPKKMTWMETVEYLGEMLKAEGITLEELIESGREIRGELFREKYARLKNK